jgi:hypothetical protein
MEPPEPPEPPAPLDDVEPPDDDVTPVEVELAELLDVMEPPAPEDVLPEVMSDEHAESASGGAMVARMSTKSAFLIIGPH